MSSERAAVAAACGAAAALVAGGHAGSTGVGAGFAWFALLGALLGALVAAAPVGTWFLLGAALVPAAWGDAGATAGAIALLAAAHFRIRVRAGGPPIELAGAVVVPIAVLRLAWPTSTGATAVVAAAALAVAALTGLPRLERRARRAVVLTGAAVAALTVVASLSALATGLAEMGRLDRAVDAVDAGLDATRAGDAELGAALFERAEGEFARVERRLRGPWAAPARAVPVLGRQLDATRALVTAAARLSAVGADVASTVDTERLRPVGGRVDLDAVAELESQLQRVRASLAAVVDELAALEPTWLASPIVDAMDQFTSRALDADADARGALRVVQLAPGLLGADGERRWFVAIVTPAETRGAGGYMGSYGVIRVAAGAIELEHLGRHVELGPPATPQIAPHGPPEYIDRYWANYGLDRFAGNVPASPHFPSVGAALAERYRAITGLPVDGAISLDPDAFAALLGLVGPVAVPDWPEPVSTANARQVLLHDQYVALSDDTEERVDFLEAVARAVYDRAIDGGLPAPADIGAALTPLLPARHLQLWSARVEEQEWFADVGASGSLAPLIDDSLAVIVNNASQSKIDWFLHRDISYDVAADGRAQLVVRFWNDAPASGLPAYIIGSASPDGTSAAGLNHTFVSVFTPRTPTAVTVDGAPVAYSVSREQGRNVMETFVDVPPGGSAELRIQLDGATPGERYRLDLHGQPVVNPDRVRVTVDGEVLFDGEQTTDLVLTRPR